MIHTTEMIEYIPVTDLYPHPDNPRKDLGDLTELADSIRQNGVMQNLTVTPRESGGYTVVIGHRRLAAAKLAGRSTVPCAVTDMDTKKQLRTMMMENMQRSDLTVYEQAQGFQLMLDMGDSIKDVSESTGFSEATIRRRTKLLELDQEKFRAAQKRGATLADYAELDKVSDPIRKNKLLDVIGTENFRFKLKAAVDEEKREKNRARIISQLNEFAKPYQGSSPYSDGDLVKYYYLQAGNEKVSRPGDTETREYFYTTDNDYSIGLFVKKIDEYLKERDERVLQDIKEQSEREKRVMGLKDVSNCARELRQEFVETVGVRAIRANMKKIVAELIFCAFDRYVDLPIEQDSMKFFGILGRDVTREEVAQAVSAPERPLLKLAYSALECDLGEGYHSWDGQYEGNNDLDMLYNLLQSLGYQMSDEEKALQDGSHELFKREEE